MSRKSGVRFSDKDMRKNSSTGGQRMGVRRMTRGTRGDAAPRRRAALDPASLILELDMAALVRRAGDSLRKHRDGDGRRKRSWWQRLFGRKRIAA